MDTIYNTPFLFRYILSFLGNPYKKYKTLMLIELQQPTCIVCSNIYEKIPYTECFKVSDKYHSYYTCFYHQQCGRFRLVFQPIHTDYGFNNDINKLDWQDFYNYYLDVFDNNLFVDEDKFSDTCIDFLLP